jgi:hypothetical protein
MRKAVFAILATTALVSTGMLATPVEAMTPASLGLAPANGARSASRCCLWPSRLRAPSYPRTPPAVMEQWWLEHLEWMQTRLDETGWNMRAL